MNSDRKPDAPPAQGYAHRSYQNQKRTTNEDGRGIPGRNTNSWQPRQTSTGARRPVYEQCPSQNHYRYTTPLSPKKYPPKTNLYVDKHRTHTVSQPSYSSRAWDRVQIKLPKPVPPPPRYARGLARSLSPKYNPDRTRKMSRHSDYPYRIEIPPPPTEEPAPKKVIVEEASKPSDLSENSTVSSLSSKPDGPSLEDSSEEDTEKSEDKDASLPGPSLGWGVGLSVKSEIDMKVAVETPTTKTDTKEKDEPKVCEEEPKVEIESTAVEIPKKEEPTTQTEVKPKKEREINTKLIVLEKPIESAPPAKISLPFDKKDLERQLTAVQSLLDRPAKVNIERVCTNINRLQSQPRLDKDESLPVKKFESLESKIGVGTMEMVQKTVRGIVEMESEASDVRQSDPIKFETSQTGLSKATEEYMNESRRAANAALVLPFDPVEADPDGFYVKSLEIQCTNLKRNTGNLDEIHSIRLKSTEFNDLEKLLFIDSFLLYPKDFKKMAQTFRNKSPGDLIRFYYKTKKLVNYKQLLHKQFHLRKRMIFDSTDLLLVATRKLGLRLESRMLSDKEALEKLERTFTKLPDSTLPYTNGNWSSDPEEFFLTADSELNVQRSFIQAPGGSTRKRGEKRRATANLAYANSLLAQEYEEDEAKAPAAKRGRKTAEKLKRKNSKPKTPPIETKVSAQPRREDTDMLQKFQTDLTAAREHAVDRIGSIWAMLAIEAEVLGGPASTERILNLEKEVLIQLRTRRDTLLIDCVKILDENHLNAEDSQEHRDKVERIAKQVKESMVNTDLTNEEIMRIRAQKLSEVNQTQQQNVQPTNSPNMNVMSQMNMFHPLALQGNNQIQMQLEMLQRQQEIIRLQTLNSLDSMAQNTNIMDLQRLYNSNNESQVDTNRLAELARMNQQTAAAMQMGLYLQNQQNNNSGNPNSM